MYRGARLGCTEARACPGASLLTAASTTSRDRREGVPRRATVTRVPFYPQAPVASPAMTSRSQPSARLVPLHPDDPVAVSYVERSLASTPLWQMAPRAPAGAVRRRDPRLLDFLATASNAPLGELEFDVLAWTITRWYQLRRPASGRIAASFGDVARGLYGKKGGGKQYALIRGALENLFNVSLDLSVLELRDGDELWRATKRKRILQTLELVEKVEPGRETAASAIELELASWLVSQLDAKTITTLGWHVLRRLSGIAKRLAIYLAAHSEEFQAITAHTARLTVALSDSVYEELGVTAARDRQRRASLERAACRIMDGDPRYSRLAVEAVGGDYVLRAERPIGAEVLPLPR